MKVKVMPRERGLGDDPFESMLDMLLGDSSDTPMPEAKSVVDQDAVQAFCEQLGIFVDVKIVPVAGEIAPGTVGNTTPTDLDKEWLIQVDDMLQDESVVTSADDIHDIDKDTFSATLRHELGHVLLLSTKMRDEHLSVDQLYAEHDKRVESWRSQHDYEQDPDEVAADAVSLKYPTVRLSVR